MLGPTKVSPTNLTYTKVIITMLLFMEQVVRRVDRPRPLKLSAANRLSALELSSVEDVVVLMENVCRLESKKLTWKDLEEDKFILQKN